MFNRWRKEKTVSGIECPLCNQVSPEGTEECSRCYYQLAKGTLEQEDSVEPKVSSDLFEELMSEDVDEGDDEAIDWSRHSFEIDDVTIAVDQYEEESDVVAVSDAPSFASFGDSAPNKGDREAKNLDPGEYELSTKDAPKDVERFVVPEDKREEELAEVPVHQVDLVVPLLPKGKVTNGDDEGPLADPSEVSDKSGEDDEQPTPAAPAAPTTPTAPTVATAPTTPTVTATAVAPEAPSVPITPATPSVPITPATPTTPTAPTAPALPSTPGTVAAPSTTSAPKLPSIPSPADSQNGAITPVASQVATTPTPAPALPAQPVARPSQGAFGSDLDIDVAAPEPAVATPTAPSRDDEMWPWSQQAAHDDLTVRRDLRQIMELVKSGELGEAERALDALGPHLGDRKDILFHVGVVLKKLGREEALRRMLENARRLYPEDQHVATALTSLGM
jgi:hypothetical protein